MKIHEFGEHNRVNILMIHGAFMSWEMFRPSIDILAGNYHIYAAALPGHDLTTKEEFISVEGIAARIGLTLVRDGLRRIDLLYGLGMGGGIAMRILADNDLPVERAVIDAGIMPAGNAGLFAKFMRAMKDTGKKSRAALAAAYPYSPEDIGRMYAVMQHMSDEAVRKVYEAEGNYSLPYVFPALPDNIEYWYGEKEERARQQDIEYAKKHIPGISLRKLTGMGHGEYAVSCPTQFAADIVRRMM